MTTDRPAGGQERADLLETLATHRRFLRYTVRDLTDDQARERTTTSALCLGGLIKHVTRMEQNWAGFIVRGPEGLSSGTDGLAAHMASFCMEEDETLAGLLERYEDVARRTDDLVASLPSLDVSQPLPPAPWFEPGARFSARRAMLHIIAETAQHAGHADIIRESLDGAKTMG
jgi:uncharacterized damage-inducible protein DinB